MFQALRLEGKWWGVFLVNPTNPKDRYLLTSPLDSQQQAEHFCSEFRRLGGMGGTG